MYYCTINIHSMKEKVDFQSLSCHAKDNNNHHPNLSISLSISLIKELIKVSIESNVNDMDKS